MIIQNQTTKQRNIVTADTPMATYAAAAAVDSFKLQMATMSADPAVIATWPTVYVVTDATYNLLLDWAK